MSCSFKNYSFEKADCCQIKCFSNYRLTFSSYVVQISSKNTELFTHSMTSMYKFKNASGVLVWNFTRFIFTSDFLPTWCVVCKLTRPTQAATIPLPDRSSSSKYVLFQFHDWPLCWRQTETWVNGLDLCLWRTKPDKRFWCDYCQWLTAAIKASLPFHVLWDLSFRLFSNPNLQNRGFLK